MNWDAVGAIEDPAQLNSNEKIRFDISVRMCANYLYKPFWLYEQGVFPKLEWENAVSDAKQLFPTPTLLEFRKNNIYFQDLRDEMGSRPSRNAS